MFTPSCMISIHAPLRERLIRAAITSCTTIFQSTLPYGSDPHPHSMSAGKANFNPRSLTGATIDRSGGFPPVPISIHAPLRERRYPNSSLHAPHKFQSTLPYGSDSIKTNYFSINLSQAFFANRLNSNTQEFYFDVRKLLVSHSSPGCEPKLNYMFHITSHRIILHYFSSCQSICKWRFFNSLFPLYSKFSKNFSKYTVVA